MSSVTIAQAKEMLNKYIEAEKAVLLNQSYTIGTRTYTRANLSAVRKGRTEWQKAVNQLSGNGGMRVRRVLFRDDY
jgi:hypothetical protein